ncbi:Enhancer of polycomb-like transcription factor protein [Striga hermonthica]|uniref:Enhancer of polycomb-like protein n=1 Tax=Striga hermonthica TaxID=68872 RepID=A0A9N7RKP1_STRHE|nr:Enhancer of polycomb-like transcription factor protein [Striga hermonthica]
MTADGEDDGTRVMSMGDGAMEIEMGNGDGDGDGRAKGVDDLIAMALGQTSVESGGYPAYDSWLTAAVLCDGNREKNTTYDEITANFAAEYFASYAASASFGCHRLPTPPSGIVPWLEHNSSHLQQLINPNPQLSINFLEAIDLGRVSKQLVWASSRSTVQGKGQQRGPRPLDINKKLPIVKSVKDFEDDDIPSSTRNSQILRLAAETDNEVQHVPGKKGTSEIPTPEFVIVDTYERDYSRTFSQTTSYLRARGARAEIGEFIEYDLDNEDEDWLQDFNKERQTLAAEKLETIIFKLEVLDHKAREKAGVITPTLGSPIPVLLTFDAAVEALQALSIKYGVFQSIYSYWKEKRERWQKPVLRRLQPPPPVNDTNPYNVFRPREKAHRLHTRRMQRRENNVQSFEKLRQVRRNLDQAKTILEALIKREEKKRELIESEVTLQRVQLKYKHETELLEDSLALPGMPSFPSKAASSEEELFDSDDVANSRPHSRHFVVRNESKRVMVPSANGRQEARRRVSRSWLHKLDPDEPVLLFTKPLLPDKLSAAGIIPPSPDPSTTNGLQARLFNFHGRIGRGGRIVFDRWNPLMQTPVECGDTSYVPPKPRHSSHH